MACVAIKFDFREIPKNAMDLTQPADSSEITIIKDTWTKRWEVYNATMIETGWWEERKTPVDHYKIQEARFLNWPWGPFKRLTVWREAWDVLHKKIDNKDRI